MTESTTHEGTTHQGTTHEGTSAHRAGRLLTGELGVELTDAAIVLAGDQITWVGAATDLPDGVETVIDHGDDATILPGLIDTHVHLAFDGSLHPADVMRAADDLERYTIMLQSARQLLSAGVTTARDLGAPAPLDMRIKEAVATGRARGPRLLTVNAPITPTGGHCWFLGGEADGVDGVRRAVRLARREGADHIKVMSTGGNLTPRTFPSEPQFTQEELEVIVEEAHRYGMLVAAHAHGVEGIRRAVAAGVDSLEHFSFTEADGTMKPDPEVVALAAAAGTYACKTISAALPAFLPESPLAPDAMRRELDSGVQIVAGTDAGIDGCPHMEFVWSLEAMVVHGMTHDETLHAATALAARSLGLAEVTGTLAAGLSADVLVVDGNPRHDLGSLRRLRTVIARGEPYTPEFSSTRSWNADMSRPVYSPLGRVSS